jgi:branched-subunit amino acid aminotransferase/4-amino-4-deoxychorismate lyase
MSAEPLAYLNGAFVPQSQAALPLHDLGLVMGATVTDLARTFRSRPFRLADHLARFRAGCSACSVPLLLGDDEVAAVAERLLAHNGALLSPGQELAVVFLATPGLVGYYLGQPGGAGDGPPTLVLHTFPLPFARYAPLFERGARLVTPPTRQPPPATINPHVKQRSRMHWWVADRQARQTGPGASALLLDLDGHITETAFANFLAVLDGTVCTPPHSSILPGVSLKVVEELCGEMGVPFAERPLTVEDCRQASEALLTGTAFCVAGVAEIDGHALPWPGPVTRRLLGAWSARVGLNVAQQIVSGR